MARITVLTAARALALEAKAIVNAVVDGSGNLTFTKEDGTTYGPWNIKGPQGNAGAAGSKWHDVVGTGAPSGTLGVVGDWAINDNGDIYEKTGTSAWTSRGNIKGPAGAAGSIVETQNILCSASGFSGNFDLFRMGKMVTMTGFSDNGTVNTGANVGTFVDTGAVVPVGWRPDGSIVSEPSPPYNTTGVQYRYRLGTSGVSPNDGKVLVQRNATNGTNMTVNAWAWRIP
jgi:hypothetical protein